MLPTIIDGGTSEERAGEINRQYPDDRYAVTHLVAEKNSLLISQIHTLIKSLSLTSQVERIVWLEEADRLTVPAQNALLKLLEEPPGKTQIILSLANRRALLPTILSRCSTLHLPDQANLPDLANLSFLKSVLPLSPGDRVLAANSLGLKREPLLVWTQTSLEALSSKMKTERSIKSLAILTQIALLVHQAHIELKSNVNVGLTMQHLFLSLPKLGQ